MANPISRRTFLKATAGGLVVAGAGIGAGYYLNKENIKGNKELSQCCKQKRGFVLHHTSDID